MYYTPQIRKAINFATNLHQVDQDQKRKGKKEPYIIHPLSVGLILARANASENTVIAGILHDTIEDCEPYGSITKDTIAKEFNSDVARMVNDVTEQDKSLTWEERKKQALNHVKDMHEDSVMVKTADVLQNLNDQIADYEELGDKMFERFNAKKDVQLKRYQDLLKEIKKAYPANPLLQELEESVEKVRKMWSK